MDEPFSGLDILMIEKILNTIKKVSLENENNTIIIISHDLENSLSVSDSAYVLAKTDPTEGASIVKNYDLAELGLAWADNIKENSDFRNILKEIKTII